MSLQTRKLPSKVCSNLEIWSGTWEATLKASAFAVICLIVVECVGCRAKPTGDQAKHPSDTTVRSIASSLNSASDSFQLSKSVLGIIGAPNDSISPFVFDTSLSTILIGTDTFRIATAAPEKAIGPGSQASKVLGHKQDRLFLFRKYLVVVYDTDGIAGDSIAVFRPDSISILRNLRGVVGEEPIYTEAGMGVWYSGLWRDLLFLDYGTGERHGFGIVKLRGTPERVYSGDYDMGFSFIEPDSIEFEEIVNTPPTKKMCPELDTLRAQGFEVGVQERVVLCLTTMAKRRTGAFNCTAWN